MEYIIYVTINKKSTIDGIHRRFIGIHKTNSSIFDGYLGESVWINEPSSYMYPKTPFQYAVKKYGVKCFIRKTLYIFNTYKEAYLKYKELTNSLTSEYYNIPPLKDIYPIYQFDKTGKLKRKWETLEECSDFYSYSKERFILFINSKKVFLNSYWATNNKININEYSDKPTPNIIFIYNKDGKLIKEFISYKECAEYLNISESFAKKHPLVHNTYYISNKLTDLYKPNPRKLQKQLTFYVYTKDKFIGKYKGKDVMKVIKLHSWLKIYNLINNKRWYDGFYLSLEELKELPKQAGSTIKVYDRYGTLLEQLPSLKEVGDKYNIPTKVLNNIKRGNRYFGDYIFKYSK